MNNRRGWKGRQPFDDPFCQRADVCLIEGVRVAPAGGALRLRGKALGSGLWGAGVWLLIDSLNSERTRAAQRRRQKGVGVRGDANAKGREEEGGS